MEIYYDFVVIIVTLLATLSTTKSTNTNITQTSENETNIEPLPAPVAWTDAPMCPLWGPMETFYEEGIEKGRYLGRWWLQDKYSDLSDLTEAGRCKSQVYSINYINQTIHRQSDYQSIIADRSISVSGEISFKDISDANLLIYKPNLGGGIEEEYRVLATDYETFTIEYTCQDNALIKRREQVWIYTRDRNPSKTVLKRAYKSLKILGLNGWKLKKVDQSCRESNAVHSMSIRRNYEVDGPSVGPGGGQRWNKKSRSGQAASRVHNTAAHNYHHDNYDNYYKQQQRSRSLPPASAPITTGELTAEILGSGLKIAQTVLAPWTLHPLMGFDREKISKPTMINNRRSHGLRRRKRRRYQDLI